MMTLLRDLGLQLLNQPAMYCFATRTPTNQESRKYAFYVYVCCLYDYVFYMKHTTL